MRKKTPSLYLPNSDKDSLVIAKKCLPAGKAVANTDTILRFTLFEGKNHKIASVVRCHDRPLEFVKPQIIGKKTIPSRGLCQILIPSGVEKKSLFLLHRALGNIRYYLDSANNTGHLPCCIPRRTDVVKTNFLQVHHI